MNDVCCYCKKELVYPMVNTKEHLVPKSQGGNSTTFNRKPCCYQCNTWRGNKMLDDWLLELLEIRTRLKYNHSTVRDGAYNYSNIDTMVYSVIHWIDYIENGIHNMLVGSDVTRGMKYKIATNRRKN